MADTLEDRLDRILPDGKGVWVPLDHGASNLSLIHISEPTRH